jgi:hypothetical protein
LTRLAERKRREGTAGDDAKLAASEARVYWHQSPVLTGLNPCSTITSVKAVREETPAPTGRYSMLEAAPRIEYVATPPPADKTAHS